MRALGVIMSMELVAALEKAIRETELHNYDYHHHTKEKQIEGWKKLIADAKEAMK